MKHKGIQPAIPRSFQAKVLEDPGLIQHISPTTLGGEPEPRHMPDPRSPVNLQMWFARDKQFPRYPATPEDFQRYEAARREAEWARQCASLYWNMEVDVFGLCHYRVDLNDTQYHSSTAVLEQELLLPPSLMAGSTTFSEESAQTRPQPIARPKTIARLTEHKIEEVCNTDDNYSVMTAEEKIENNEIAFNGAGQGVSVELTMRDESSEAEDLASPEGSSSNPVEQSNFKPTKMAKEDADPQMENVFLSDIHSRAYRTQQSENLPDEENCALWLANLPADITETRIFRTIHTGAVFALRIKKASNGHTNSAAKLVFTNPEGAARYLKVLQSGNGIRFGGLRVFGTYNKYGYKEYPMPKVSRVLQIKGPTKYMDQEYWVNYFSQFFVFQLDEVRTLQIPEEGKGVIEFQFARVDGQSGCAYLAITKDPNFKGIISVRYAADPCDPSAGGR